MLSAKNIFQKNDFPEIILRQKQFYVETNRALFLGAPSLTICAFLSSGLEWTQPREGPLNPYPLRNNL
jgi:hypothetical protein